MTHVKDGCSCTTSQYPDVQTKMASHFTDQHGVDAMADRIKLLLKLMRDQGEVEFSPGEGGFYEVRLPALGAEEIAETDSESDLDQIEEKVMKTALEAMHLLVRLWLIENGGEVQDFEEGLLAGAVRERYKLPATQSIQVCISNALKRMVSSGEIYRQRTKDRAAEEADPKKVQNSSRTYAIELLRPAEDGERERLEAEAQGLLAAVLASTAFSPPAFVRAETSDEFSDSEAATPVPVEDEPADDEPVAVLLDEDQPVSEVAEPTYEELLESDELRWDLAERVWRFLSRVHEALATQARTSDGSHVGKWHKLPSIHVLTEAGFSEERQAEAQWYLEQMVDRPRELIDTSFFGWWHTGNPVSREAVILYIVQKKVIYRPDIEEPTLPLSEELPEAPATPAATDQPAPTGDLAASDLLDVLSEALGDSDKKIAERDAQIVELKQLAASARVELDAAQATIAAQAAKIEELDARVLTLNGAATQRALAALEHHRQVTEHKPA
jgi:hypothetical protein